MRVYNIDFFKNRKKFFAFSIFITLVGIVFNVIFGTKLDMQFTGGALIEYSYSGSVEKTVVEEVVGEITGKTADVKINDAANGQSANLSLTFVGTEELPLDQQTGLTNKLIEKNPDSDLKILESSSINPSMGRDFFWKCIICVIAAMLILIIYIAFRFRKIGGYSAGVMAIISLFHDIAMVYFTFIVFRMPINDSFIAVILTVLGYSLNDTIIIYDRIRENRKIMGPKVECSELVNNSINQTLERSIYTVLATVIAILTVYIIGIVYNITTITTFALPMLIGVVTGCYSSICVGGPLYVMWQNHKKNKNSKNQDESSGKQKEKTSDKKSVKA